MATRGLKLELARQNSHGVYCWRTCLLASARARGSPAVFKKNDSAYEDERVFEFASGDGSRCYGQCIHRSARCTPYNLRTGRYRHCGPTRQCARRVLPSRAGWRRPSADLPAGPHYKVRPADRDHGATASGRQTGGREGPCEGSIRGAWRSSNPFLLDKFVCF